MNYTYHESPIGALLLAGEGRALELLSFPVGSQARRVHASWQRDERAFRAVRTQLDEYFAGTRREFDLELAPRGTAFQLAVWAQLRTIPFGGTCSYSHIARAIGKPLAVRAVGAANGRNPLPIIVPCHRVIGADGSLTGFGGGLPVKEFLLRLEGWQAPPAAGKQRQRTLFEASA
jgi:methylated-DNA-[protein]-cysteine S-methyltransferase